MTTLRAAKQALRETAVATREALAPEWRLAASQAIAARIAGMDSFAQARVVLLTLPYRSEWDALLLAGHALAAGKVVAAPRVDRSTRMLRAFQIGDLERDVEAGYRGIPEPRASCPGIGLDSLEWVLVPGLAFDAAGRRLGYGGGYYDRLLPFVPRDAPRVAGAFEVQIVERVPSAPHDIAVDCVVTERRTLHADSRPG